METDEKTDIEVARASSAEADSEQPGSPVSVPDHSSILLDEKKSDDEFKTETISREDKPMETTSAYRGGPCRLEDPSVNDSDDEDDIRRSSVDRKESQSPKQDSDPYVAWKNPAASVPSVSLISSNSINLLGGYEERSNEIEHLTLSLNNNCAVIPSTNMFLMAHENFEFCSVLADSDPAVLLDRIVATPVSPNSYRYTVPDSNYYLELKIKDQLIAIEKKKK
ncbi:hypothetical protein CAEBREN_10990 [Caenorhabditis brenneri]|uniref:Uncharacterized protein n=1 Tax=Caenorhabditis brenneri TaxID=135651 RepID=G0ND75_CAEBE|nr:hypothetical protein CAEBREN_10990 [Caenorhabditis brenneri]